MSNVCQLEVKTLKGDKHILSDIAFETTTIEELYRIVHDYETAPDGKWKLLVIVKGSMKTLKWAERDRRLVEFGVEAGQQYRLEVVLDMGACHSGLCRLNTKE
eukprot:Nitzschia sp. Nitz4//scaffold101_size76361//69091//69399//NITZ4_005616-RA/size76361-processed-gene-0.134-mRNA-1//1//CDS//3329532200//3288//frame0